MYRDPYSHIEWEEQDEGDLHERLMDDERDYYNAMAEVLSHGSREEVQEAIRKTEQLGRSAYDIQDAMLGADYPVDAGGFAGSQEQYQMVLDEMQRYGHETGNEDWANAAYLTEVELDNSGWDTLGPTRGSFGMKDVIGGLGKVASDGVNYLKKSRDYRAPKTGDIHVAPHTRTVNGKRVTVRGHNRKR